MCCFCHRPDSSFSLSHFLGEPSSIYDKTNPDWAPNQNLGYDFRGVSVSSQERYERTQERIEKRRRSEYASVLLELSHQSTDDMLVKADASPSVEENRVKDCQTEITNDYITSLEMKNTSLKEKLKLNSLNEESFREDNDKVSFYTGLPNWEILCLFNFIKNSSPELKSSRGILNSLQKFLLDLVRIRLNLSGRTWGTGWGVSVRPLSPAHFYM